MFEELDIYFKSVKSLYYAKKAFHREVSPDITRHMGIHARTRGYRFTADPAMMAAVKYSLDDVLRFFTAQPGFKYSHIPGTRKPGAPARKKAPAPKPTDAAIPPEAFAARIPSSVYFPGVPAWEVEKLSFLFTSGQAAQRIHKQVFDWLSISAAWAVRIERTGQRIFLAAHTEKLPPDYSLAAIRKKFEDYKHWVDTKEVI